MATHVDLKVQEEIYKILSEDSILKKMKVETFDQVPDNYEPVNYITIGEDIYTDFGGHDFDGFDATIQIDTWSAETSKKKCKEIQARVYELLHDKWLDLGGFTTINFRCTLSNISIDPDGRTYHGVQQFNLVTTC